MAKFYNYNGIALTEYREGTNCGGHIEDKESCIHLKFGKPFKYASFTKEFEEKHADFIKLYDKVGDSDGLENDREYMLKVWREIIRLKDAGELVVICNMCDLECPDAAAVAFYAIQQGGMNFTGDELMSD